MSVPVSYTHLDVYKRQVRDFPGAYINGVSGEKLAPDDPTIADAFARYSADKAAGAVAPVSYTHLDVYKRQDVAGRVVRGRRMAELRVFQPGVYQIRAAVDLIEIFRVMGAVPLLSLIHI